jgi:hypothetical protein
VILVLSSIVAVALVVAQGLAVWAFLRFVKTFGAYTESQQKMTNALLYTHESNLLLHQETKKMLEELRAMRALKAKEVA